MQTIMETPYFIKSAEKLLSEEERHELLTRLATQPDAGVLVKGTRCLRKLRIGRDGMGNRGGARVIYFFYTCDMPIGALAVYAKNEKADLSASEKEQFNKLADAIIEQYKRR